MEFLATIAAFVAFHGGPADHFGVFADQLEKEGVEVYLYASGPAYDKLKQRSDVRLFSAEEVDQIANECAECDVVITDVGHPLDIQLHEALEKRAPLAIRCCYYDNQESFVPGGYSETAAKVMQLADRTLFANANLVSDPAFQRVKERIGIGYYSTKHAERIATLRKEGKARARKVLLEALGIEEAGQQLFVFCGGNNSVYFEKALPAFLKLTKNSNQVFVLQQHPGAVASGIERELVKDVPVYLSPVSSEESLVAADAVLYYQTSMAPLFLLAGIPTIQVGHERYEDVLVRQGLCPAVTNPEEWEAALKTLGDSSLIDRETLLKGIGVREDWRLCLTKSVLTP